MKNIKYIILTIVCIGAFSCGDDTFTRAYVDEEVKTPLTGTITIDSPITKIFSSDEVEATVTLPQSFTVESTVEITISSSFVAAFEFDPYEGKSYITVPAGASSASGTFEIPDFGQEIPYGGAPLTVTLTGVALTQPEDGAKVDDPYTLSSDPVTINLLQSNITSSAYLAPGENVLKLSLDWQGPYDLNDLDLYVYNSDFSEVFESAESGDRFEGDFFNNPANEEYADGDYIIEVAIWNGDTPIPFQLTLTQPDGTREVFEGTVEGGRGGYVDYGLTQTTDGEGVRTFTLYEL
ncbi:hypothetical protein [Thalassobellus sediminis]|uniref:hypothetical protein n=1 Tax=Thalassobellus sediminis TaxID=3367753 RepID=UPI0037B9BECE